MKRSTAKGPMYRQMTIAIPLSLLVKMYDAWQEREEASRALGLQKIELERAQTWHAEATEALKGAKIRLDLEHQCLADAHRRFESAAGDFKELLDKVRSKALPPSSQT